MFLKKKRDPLMYLAAWFCYPCLRHIPITTFVLSTPPGLHVLLSKNLLFTHFVCLFAGMPVFRFLPEFRFSVSPNLHIFIYFQPIFGCFGSNLCTFSGFSQQLQVFWVGLTGIPGLFCFVCAFLLFVSVFVCFLLTLVYTNISEWPPGQSAIVNSEKPF